MAIELRTYASGDTDYISKMNANVSDIQNAINALQNQAAAGAGGNSISAGMMMSALFNGEDALIGVGSYKPTASGTTLNIAPGGMYLGATQSAVASFNTVPLNFAAQSAGVKYIVIDPGGFPQISATQTDGTSYSVSWNGTTLSNITRIAPAFYDASEANASRISTVAASSYATLDHRLEATEGTAKSAQTTANAAMNAVNELAAEVGAAVAEPPPIYRKIGCSTDGVAGVKGAIQIDFEGTIVGWSVIADVPGTLTVEIDRKASSAPPAVPSIPNLTTDKISASAPVQLSAAQSAAVGTTGVATWNKALKPWDVIQFNVVAASVIQRATFYLRVLEAPRSTSVIMAHIPSTVDMGLSYGPVVIASE